MDWGSLFGGLGSFIGGVSKFFPGGGSDNSQAMNFAREQLQFQREAARHGIRWRVADAKESGVHPLFALGAPSFQPSPVSFPVGDSGGGTDIGGALSQMSQGVGRAIHATASKAEREISELDLIAATQGAASRQLDLEMKQIQLASMKARLARDQIGPPLPGAPVRANTGEAEIKPNEITSSQPDAPTTGAGPAGPSITHHRVGAGYQAFPAKGVEGLDDMDLSNVLGIDWTIRNRIVGPNVDPKGHWSAPALDRVKRDFPGAIGVRFDRSQQLWVPVYPDVPDRDLRRSGHGAWRHRDSTWTGAP